MKAAWLLLLVGVCLAQSQPPSPTPSKASQNKQQTAGGKNGNAADDKAIPPPPTVFDTKKTKDSTKQEKSESSPDWWIAIFTAVIAVATAAQAYIYWRQKELMAKSLTETSKAADAATKSAETGEKALKLTQCADILVDSVSILDPSGRTITPVAPYSRVSVKFKNFGHTRANNVVFKISLDIPPIPKSDRSNGPTVLGAGDTQTLSFIRFGSSLNQQMADDINQGKIIMRLKGSVSYCDIFGDPHEIDVGCRYSGRLGIWRNEEDPDPEDETGLSP